MITHSMKSKAARALVAAVGLMLAGRVVSAQTMLADAKAKAQKAAAATNAHIAAEQKPEGPAKQTTDSNEPASKVTRVGTKLAVATADTSGPPPTIMRELYTYAADGRRDPFVSLLTTSDLRPTMSDLRLTAILYDHSAARRSVATMRDLVTNAQYRVTTGSKLGRMTVSAIRLKVVLFTIDEFGTTRQDSLVIGDTTKVRGK